MLLEEFLMACDIPRGSVDYEAHLARIAELFAQLAPLRSEYIMDLRGLVLDPGTGGVQHVLYTLPTFGSLSVWLHRWVAEYGGIDSGLFRMIADHTARGLAFLHSQSPTIVHGDVRAGNIMAFCSPQGAVVLKLANAGMAAVVGHAHAAVPAQLLSSQPTSHDNSIQHPQGDMFSYGIMLAEIAVTVLLGSGRPVSVDDPWAKYANGQALVSEAVDRLRVIDSTLADIVARCCSATPGARPTAEDVVRGLHRSASDDNQFSWRDDDALSPENTVTKEAPPPPEPTFSVASVAAAAAEVGLAKASAAIADDSSLKSKGRLNCSEVGKVLSNLRVSAKKISDVIELLKENGDSLALKALLAAADAVKAIDVRSAVAVAVVVVVAVAVAAAAAVAG